jgi:hypothetical protein
MKKFVSILLIFALGFSLMSHQNSMPIEKTKSSCCKNHQSGEKGCCHKSDTDKKSGCDGKCHEKSCHSINFYLGFPSPVKIGEQTFAISENTNGFLDVNNKTLSGHLSIWALPKI